MNRITRKKSPMFTSSKTKSNPFESRGLDKFQEVYSELERMRAAIAAQEGVSTSDVWFTKGTSKGRDWVPVVVGKSSTTTRPSSLSSHLTRQHSIPHWETDDEDLVLSAAHKSVDREESEESRSSENTSCSSSWFPVRSEQVIHDLQQFTRKALKAITVFIMLVAAVADVFVALVASCASSFVAKHLRPLSTRHLPEDCNKALARGALTLSTTPPASPVYSCMSAPSSPRYQLDNLQLHHQLRSKLSDQPPTSFSTPVSPVRSSCTFFSPARPVELSKLSKLSQANNAEQVEESLPRSDPIPVIFTVVVILLSLTAGQVTAVLAASTTWFVFPFARKLVSESSNRSVC